MLNMKYDNTILAIPPGETIQELLEDRGISQENFASMMNISADQVIRLISGEAAITAEMALQLEYIFGVPQAFWCNLEGIYRKKLTKLESVMRCCHEEKR